MASATINQPLLPRWLYKLQEYRGYIVPVGFVAMMAVLLVPMPPAAMDVLIALNIALSLVILLTTLYMTQPLDFSVFPSLLLGTTLFRLVLNIASTRLILTAKADSPEGAVNPRSSIRESDPAEQRADCRANRNPRPRRRSGPGRAARQEKSTCRSPRRAWRSPPGRRVSNS